MLSVIMLSVIMLSVIMLSVIILSVIMLSVIMLSVVKLSIMAPKFKPLLKSIKGTDRLNQIKILKWKCPNHNYKICFQGWGFNEILAIDIKLLCQVTYNRTMHIRHQCRKTTVLGYHRCLINTGVEKKNSI